MSVSPCFRGRCRVGLLVVALVALVASSEAILAQESDSPRPSIPADSASLEGGPHATMRMLYERTLFAVDVLRLTVAFGAEDGRRIEALAADRGYSDHVADSIARIATASRDAFVRIRFERDVSQDQFFDGVRDNLGKAVAAGIIAESTYDMISGNLPVWYGFLAERGIVDGDGIVYRILGDTLRTQFIAYDGEVVRDQTDIGAERRLAVLGSYYAPDSNFREKLIRSLFERGR